MYAWIWRHLPGSGPVRVLAAATAVAVLLAALVLLAFPALDAVLPYADVDVGS